MANVISLPAKRPLVLVLAVAFYFVVGAVSSSGSAEPALSGSDLICHTDEVTECYPRIFEATNEFQCVHDDQELPAGMHVRLNVWTGEKEAKLYNTSEESALGLEGLPVDRAVVLVDQPGSGDGDAKSEQVTRRIPKGAPAYDAVGAVKEPVGSEGRGGHDAATFGAAVTMLKDGSLQDRSLQGKEQAQFVEVLEQLGEFAHDVYYGSRLAEDEEAMRMLLCLMTTGGYEPGTAGVVVKASADAGVTTQVLAQRAGAIVAAAVQNNPTALRGLERLWERHKAASCSRGTTLGGRVFGPFETAAAAAVTDGSDVDGAVGGASSAWIRSRLSAINGLIKSETIMQDFLERDGLTEMLRLMVTLKGPEHESTRARAAHLVMDNFLDANMGADVTRWPLPEAADRQASQSCDLNAGAECWDSRVQQLAKAYGYGRRTGQEPEEEEEGMVHWSDELWRLLQERKRGQDARRDEL